MRTSDDLRQLQSLPLELKVKMTETRIRQWVDEFGEDGVCISYSGGKDSTVLSHIVDDTILGNAIPRVFSNTGLEYPEIVQFVKKEPRAVIIRPEMNFKKVIEKYGYPFISKEVSERVYYAQRYLEWYYKTKNGDDSSSAPTAYSLLRFQGLKGTEEYKKLLEEEKIPDEIILDFIKSCNSGVSENKELYEISKVKSGEPSMFDYSKYKFLVLAPFKFSNKCCDVMKKAPLHRYQKQTGRKPMTAQMAQESRLRTQKWIQHGCNGFDMKSPISNPMAFWTEQDVLQYIKKHNIDICSVYGKIVQDEEQSEYPEGQLCFLSDDHVLLGKSGELIEKTCVYKTTGCKRTGCMFCGYGCHLEKEGQGRFEVMKKTHPKLYEWIMKPMSEGGLDYKAVIDWINENGNLNIRY